MHNKNIATTHTFIKNGLKFSIAEAVYTQASLINTIIFAYSIG